MNANTLNQSAPDLRRPPVHHWYWILACLLLVVAATCAMYIQTLDYPFVLDDLDLLPRNNPYIKKLTPLSEVFKDPWRLVEASTAPPDTTASGRPLVSLSLALNYAISGEQPPEQLEQMAAERPDRAGYFAQSAQVTLRRVSYHVTNIAIHCLSAMVLFGLMRRTLLLDRIPDRLRQASLPLAFAVALLWALHPLQTGSVTYMIQRAESMMGLFYLLTLYCALRGHLAGSARARCVWYVTAAAACALGMMTKEVMFTAPLMVLLYDAVFFRLRGGLRPVLYAGVAMTWAILFYLVSLDPRGHSVGFTLSSAMTWWDYLQAQGWTVARYLRLAVFPVGMSFDYPTEPRMMPMWHFPEAAPYAAVVVGLLALTVLAFVLRRPLLGFLGAWFFLILGPTSSVLPITTEVVAEHRMYLPSIAIVAAAVLGVYALIEWGLRRLVKGQAVLRWALMLAGFGLVIEAALLLGFQTVQRNRQYESEISIWSDALDHFPQNARAHNNLGIYLFWSSKPVEATQHLLLAIENTPEGKYPDAHNNLGVVLAQAGKWDEAIEHYRLALKYQPVYPDANLNAARAHLMLNQPVEAEKQARRAMPGGRGSSTMLAMLGSALAEQERWAEAVPYLADAVRVDPSAPDASSNLVRALIRGDRVDQAERFVQDGLARQPRSLDLREARADVLVARKDYAQALVEYDLVARQRQMPRTFRSLAFLLASCPQLRSTPETAARLAAAMNLATEARRQAPNDCQVWDALAAAYAAGGQFEPAIQAAERAVTLAREGAKPALAQEIADRLELYRKHQPFVLK